MSKTLSKTLLQGNDIWRNLEEGPVNLSRNPISVMAEPNKRNDPVNLNPIGVMTPQPELNNRNEQNAS